MCSSTRDCSVLAPLSPIVQPQALGQLVVRMSPDPEFMTTAATDIVDDDIPSAQTKCSRLKNSTTIRSTVPRHNIDMATVQAERTVIAHPSTPGRHIPAAVHAHKRLITMDGVASNLCIRPAREQKLHQALTVQSVDCPMPLRCRHSFSDSSGLSIRIQDPAKGLDLASRPD